MLQHMKVVSRFLLIVVLIMGALALVACAPETRLSPRETPLPTALATATPPPPTPAPSATSTLPPAPPTPTLSARPTSPPPPATPAATEPAAGICGIAQGNTVTVTLNPDVPMPRCSIVTASQRLHVVNRTEATVEVRLGQFSAKLAPGRETTFDASFATYLAPRVHQVFVSYYAGGAGPELWLKPT